MARIDRVTVRLRGPLASLSGFIETLRGMMAIKINLRENERRSGEEPILVSVVRLDLGYELGMMNRYMLEAGRFTTNPGLVWSEYMAEYYGTAALSAGAAPYPQDTAMAAT